MQINIITFILIEQGSVLIGFAVCCLKVLLTGIRGKVALGKTIDASSLEKTLAAASALKAWTCGSLASFRSAHSTRQRQILSVVSPSTPNLIPLLAVLSQSSGFSRPGGGCSQPATGGPQERHWCREAFSVSSSTHPFWAQPGGL